MSLKKYIAEAEYRHNHPDVGDTFAIELEDGTLLETYILAMKENAILLDATDRIVSVLNEWNYIGDRAGEVLLEGVAEGATPASTSKVLRLIQRHKPEWFDNYGMGEVEDTVVDLADMGKFQGMSAVDALALVGQELESLYGNQGVAEDVAEEQKLEECGDYNDEESVSDQDRGEYDYEGAMAKDDLYTIIRAARRLNGMLDDDENMPEWVQSKINKAADYVDTAADYIESNKEQDMAEGEMDEAKYQGREVPLGKPMRGDVKKFKVYVRDPSSGNIKKVNFGHGGTSAKRAGQKTMKIRKSDPARRRSFRARHNCDNPGPRTKARYWSCRKW